MTLKARIRRFTGSVSKRASRETDALTDSTSSQRLGARIHTGLRAIARRDLLLGLINFAWVAPLVLGLVEAAKYLRFEPPTTGGTVFNLGTRSTLPRLPAYIEVGQVWLHQDNTGYYSVDAICTHLGCTVRLQPDGFYKCPCHGSRFEPDGDVLNGPATLPLRFLQLTWGTNGQLTVDRSQEVEPGFRLPPS
jgi:nitrite reductase/ring-hydroxylating ferredoxin subunit